MNCRRSRRALTLMGLMFILSSGCGSRDLPSAAADPIIARASSSEERRGLVQARDDIDAEMRAAVEALEREIERLEEENEGLRDQLGE